MREPSESGPHCDLWLCGNQSCQAIIGHREGHGFSLVSGVTHVIHTDCGMTFVSCWRCGRERKVEGMNKVAHEIEPLTKRETEVLQLLASGASNQELGLMLSISVKTVETHLSSIYAKLEVRNRAAAMLWYLTLQGR